MHYRAVVKGEAAADPSFIGSTAAIDPGLNRIVLFRIYPRRVGVSDVDRDRSPLVIRLGVEVGTGTDHSWIRREGGNPNVGAGLIPHVPIREGLAGPAGIARDVADRTIERRKVLITEPAC